MIFFNATYRMFLHSPKAGYDYLETNGLPLSSDIKTMINEEMNANNAIEAGQNLLFNSFNIYIIRTNDIHFCLGDSPVLYYEFNNTKFIFPFMPKYAIVCAFKDDNDYDVLMEIDDETATEINKKMILQADRYIVFHEDDSDYFMNLIKEVIKTKEVDGYEYFQRKLS